MKRPEPIDEEYTFADGVIISETDLKGIITYANRKFIEISGYSKEELVGKPHSIIRHPDMPKAAFKQMWDTIENDKEWQGIVKNLRKDGRYYWVDTYIKPVYKDGKKVGYIAARHPAKQIDVLSIKNTYAQMLEDERKG
ncbi:PAS domain-containing protein [Hydrogenimonas urashimensis]|uniref:PAS domain-containing protein n=1 Tax=Hydrogenimonas urashimensis TaxID=2740515 RepID=UPI0019152C84|nr:PAS domain-containing protein [Hydrogenimonas urashimensis]